MTVAILSQNDDVGEAYVAGLMSAIEGSQVEVVEQRTFEATDTAVDSQMVSLAGTGADVFFNANSSTPLTATALLKAQQLGWLPSVFLTSVANSKATVLDPANAAAFPEVFTTGFSKGHADPDFAEDEDVQQYMSDMEAHSPELIENMVPHCVWGYQMAATLEAAFQSMESPTRANLMDAIRDIRDVEVPMMLPGVTVDASTPGQPPVSDVRVQTFEDGRYVPAESFDD